MTGATSGTSNDLNYITGNDAGMMQLELAAADVNRLGRMRLTITDAANHCPVFHDYCVLPADIYDAMFTAGAGYGDILNRTTIATLASQVSFTLTAGSADNDAYNGCIIVVQDVSTAAQKAVAVIGEYTGATKTVTLLNDPAVFTMAATDIVTIIADRALKATVDNRTLDVSAGGEAGLDWANIGAPTTAQNLSATNIDADQVVASVSGAVGSVTGLTAATVHSDLDDIQSKIGTPSDLGGGATLAGNLSDIEAQTDDIGAAGAGLTALATQASVNTIDDFLDTEIAAIKAVTDALPNAGALTTIQGDLDNLQTRVPAALVGGRMDSDVGAMQAAVLTAAAIATDAIDADALAADAVTEIWAKAMTDLSSVPGVTASVLDAINLLFELARNKATQTATVTTIYKDDGTTALATSTVSDDGVTATRGEFA